MLTLFFSMGNEQLDRLFGDKQHSVYKIQATRNQGWPQGANILAGHNLVPLSSVLSIRTSWF